MKLKDSVVLWSNRRLGCSPVRLHARATHRFAVALAAFLSATFSLSSSAASAGVVSKTSSGVVLDADEPVEITGPIEFAKPAMIPAPVEFSFQSNVAVRIDKDCRFSIACPTNVAMWVSDHVYRWFGVRPNIFVEILPKGSAAFAKSIPAAASSAAPVVDPTSPEAYSLSAKPGKIAIRANTFAGVKLAMTTLRQAAQCVPAGERVTGWWLPAMEVKDAPALGFRGLHVCWFPETPSVLVERIIRYAAYYKYNHVVLETWGTFRSERHPWWGWPDGRMTKGEIRRLRAIADDLGVTLIPQFNVFGHASMSRVLSAKHAALDLDPSRQPLFEPDGWNWCLSNPEARRIIGELVAEMHEAFGNPPYFHIGCDEAQAPGCARCRAARPYAALVARHIVAIRDLLKSRGAQAMMWHDMLLERGDARWRGFYANGSKDEAEMAATLPRDLVICDWYYGNASAPTNYPTLAHFQKLGFPTLTCPWNDREGTPRQAVYAAQHGLLGLLATTWHHAYGREFLCDIVAPAACGAWGTPGDGCSLYLCTRHWRQMGWDAQARDYRDLGVVSEQVPSSSNVEIRPGG